MISEIYLDLRAQGAVRSEAQFAQDFLGVYRGYMHALRVQSFTPSADVLIRLHGALVSRGYTLLADHVMRKLLSGESRCARMDTKTCGDVGA